MIILFFLSIVFVLSLAVSWINIIKDKRRFNIKGPFPLPVLGNGLLFVVKTTEILSLIHRLSKQYGEAYLVYFLSNPYIILCHPRYIEPILMSSELITKGRAYTFLKPWLGNGLLVATGSAWKAHRKFLTPAFHFNILQTFIPVFCKNGRILIEKLDEHADGKKSVDIFPIISKAALDNVTEAIMGQCVNAQSTTYSEYLNSLETVTQIVALRGLVPILSNEFVFSLTPYKKRQEKAVAFMHNYTRGVVNARRRELKTLNISSLDESNDLGTKNKHAFLDLLLLAEADGERLSEQALLDEVETFMFAGQDTTTSGIVFSLYCIAQHADVQEKVYQEQKNIFEDDMDREITNADLIKMKYLDLVLKESMRLYPPVPMTERMITEDVEVAGVKYKRGTSVTLNMYECLRHPDIYEDPQEFRPERFQVGAADAWKPYYVFSAGPRNCIGQKFALLEVKVTVAEVIRRFELSLGDEDPQICADLVMRSRNGVQLKFKRR